MITPSNIQRTWSFQSFFNFLLVHIYYLHCVWSRNEVMHTCWFNLEKTAEKLKKLITAVSLCPAVLSSARVCMLVNLKHQTKGYDRLDLQQKRRNEKKKRKITCFNRPVKIMGRGWLWTSTTCNPSTQRQRSARSWLHSKVKTSPGYKRLGLFYFILFF